MKKNKYKQNFGGSNSKEKKKAFSKTKINFSIWVNKQRKQEF